MDSFAPVENSSLNSTPLNSGRTSPELLTVVSHHPSPPIVSSEHLQNAQFEYQSKISENSPFRETDSESKNIQHASRNKWLSSDSMAASQTGPYSSYSDTQFIPGTQFILPIKRPKPSLKNRADPSNYLSRREPAPSSDAIINTFVGAASQSNVKEEHRFNFREQEFDQFPSEILRDLNKDIGPRTDRRARSHQREIISLDVSGNKIGSIDEDSGVHGEVENLIALNASFNALTSVNLGNFPEIVDLDLRDNKLTGIRVNDLKKLESLRLDNNPIENIDVTGLPDLKRLSLRGTGLKELPTGWRTLPEECEIDLTDTDLSPEARKEIRAHQSRPDDGPAIKFENSGQSSPERHSLESPSREALALATTQTTRSLQKGASTSSPSTASTSFILTRRASLASIDSVFDARSNAIYKRQRKILSQLKEIHHSRYGAQVFKSSKMAFLTAFKGSEALRTGIFPYDPKVDTSMSQSLIRTGASATIGPAAAALGKALGFTIPKVLEKLPGVGDVLGFVFEQVATMGYNHVHEQIAGSLDPAARNIHFLSDSVSRALALVHGNNPELNGSDDSLREKILKRKFGDAWKQALEIVSGRGKSENTADTMIRVVMTQYVMEIVFALASKEATLQSLIDQAIDTITPKQYSFETDNLKLQPIVEWHLRKHFDEDVAQRADYNWLAVWGERDTTITQHDLDDAIDKKRERNNERKSELAEQINAATADIAKRTEDNTRRTEDNAKRTEDNARRTEDNAKSTEDLAKRIDQIETNDNETNKKITVLVEKVSKTDKSLHENTKELVQDFEDISATVKGQQVKLNVLEQKTTTLTDDVINLMEASTSQVDESTVAKLNTLIEERNQTIDTLTRENSQLNNKVVPLENKVDELIALVREVRSSAAKSQGRSIEALHRINHLSPTVMAELNQQKQINDELTAGLAQQQEYVDRNAAHIAQLQPEVQQAKARARTARSTAAEANRRLNTLTPALHRRMDNQSSTLSHLQRRTERDIGELHAFAFETEDRMDRMAQRGELQQDIDAMQETDTRSLDTDSTQSSTPAHEVAPGKKDVERARFSLEMMANLLESYIMSVSVRMPGEFLPSKQLSWSQDGTLVVTVPRTLRCAAFQGSIQQFLHERHKDRTDAYRFPTDMKSRLTELSMKRSHYSALVEYAIPFTATLNNVTESSGSSSRQG
jgi:methyl-accepting chemotaxis protein